VEPSRELPATTGKWREACPSADTCKYRAVAVREHFAPWRAVNVTAEALDAYIAKRQRAGKADATVNREMAVLRSAFKLAAQRKRLNAMQVPTLSRLPGSPWSSPSA